MKITITGFSGEFPRLHASRLPEGGAEIAQDVDFSGGTLRPRYSVAHETDLVPFSGGPTTRTTFKHYVGAAPYWLQFPSECNVIVSPIKDDVSSRVYWSGDTRSPTGKLFYAYAPSMLTGGALFPTQFFPLGIPAPTNIATTVSNHPVVSANDPTETRVYVFTYVNAIGEESAPSLPSRPLTVPMSNAQVTLSGMLTDTGMGDYQIVKKRIYRSVVGSSGQAVFEFVHEIAVADTGYVDTTETLELSGVLQTSSWSTPRDGMKGLGLTAYGVAYAFIGKIVCMSYPFHVYAWPREFELTTQYEIVAIGHYESNLIVATRGNPAIITGVDPISGMQMTELPLNEACVSARSMVSMGHAAIYASPNGLVMASANGAELVTAAFFGKDEWQALNPSSIHAVEHRGKYLFFWSALNGEQGAYLFDPSNVNGGIVRLSLYCIQAIRDMRSDTLYLLQENNVLQRFDDLALDRKPYRWRSRKYRADEAKGVRLLAAQVVADSYDCITFRIYADDQLLYQRSALNDKPFRLPNHSAKRYWQLEVEGTDTVMEICAAESLMEITA